MVKHREDVSIPAEQKGAIPGLAPASSTTASGQPRRVVHGGSRNEPTAFASVPLMICIAIGALAVQYATSAHGIKAWNTVKTFPSNIPTNYESLNVQAQQLIARQINAFESFTYLVSSSGVQLLTFLGIDGVGDTRKLSLEGWIDKEEQIAWKALFRNIEPDGTREGCVVASPSTGFPDYWYVWTRDSALVMRSVVQQYISFPSTSFSMRPHQALIRRYVASCKAMQHQNTIIGGFHDGGLGEVKYYVDYSPFKGEWGRPQHDVRPASRAITLIELAEFEIEHGESDWVRSELYDSKFPSESVIKGDLEHIAKKWSEPGFDLWEEVSGAHFYTLLTIRTALANGARLAATLGDQGAADYYLEQANEITPYLVQFWSPQRNLIRVSLNQTNGRDSTENAFSGDVKYGKKSEIDSAVILAVLHAGKGTEWEHSERTVATLEAILQSFKPIYPINENRTYVALGRYPEDRYDGTGVSLAHPWFLCTLAASEYLYLHSHYLSTTTSPLKIDHITSMFYSRFIKLPFQPINRSRAKLTVKVNPGSVEMKSITQGMKEIADGMIGVVREFARSNGSMNEQFDRVSGEGRGARDLTWSYAAAITAFEARKVANQVEE